MKINDEKKIAQVIGLTSNKRINDTRPAVIWQDKRDKVFISRIEEDKPIYTLDLKNLKKLKVKLF